LNQWIRTSRAFDGVIDFEKAVRDPADRKKRSAQSKVVQMVLPKDKGLKTEQSEEVTA